MPRPASSDGYHPLNRFNRVGNVIPDRRRYMRYVGTEDYREGLPLRVARRSSPGRLKFKAQRFSARLAA